jgi:SAM-dependent methyltransferase
MALDRYGCYQIVGTDKSAAMVAKAREKAATGNPCVAFRQMDFLDITLQQKFDIVVSIFDSVNYLHSEEDIRQLLYQVREVMDRNSLFIFDFTTPKNSEQAIKHLNNEEGITSNNYHFFRKSEYDADRQIHYNIFEIEKLADDRQEVLEQVTEEHRQRTYSLTQMQEIIADSHFEIVANYSEFDLDEATPESLRITMVLRCLNTQ